jgi:hypothetical protein
MNDKCQKILDILISIKANKESFDKSAETLSLVDMQNVKAEIDRLLEEVNELTIYEVAKSIMRNNFFGPDDLKTTFGFEVKPEHIPPIPFTRQELEQARAAGLLLVLRRPVHGDADKMTLLSIAADYTSKSSQYIRDLVSNANWVRQFGYANHETIRPGWALTGVIGPAKKNILQQTTFIKEKIQYLTKNTKTPDTISRAINEFELKNQYLTAIEDLFVFGVDDKRLNIDFLRGVYDLQLNQLFRPNAAEILYDILLHIDKLFVYDLYQKPIFTLTKPRTDSEYAVTVTCNSHALSGKIGFNHATGIEESGRTAFSWRK